MTPTIVSISRGTSSGDWVDAAPFRAYLFHLIWASGLSGDVVAELARVSQRTARHLAHGRRGRPVRRISPETARRLLQITVGDLLLARQTPVSARRVSRRLAQLGAVGWSDEELAIALRIDAATVADLRQRRSNRCSQLVEVRVLLLASVHLKGYLSSDESAAA